MSLKLVEGVKTFKIRHMQEEQLKLRIGVHTGIVRLVGNKHRCVLCGCCWYKKGRAIVCLVTLLILHLDWKLIGNVSF